MAQIEYQFKRDICPETIESIFNDVYFQQTELSEEFGLSLNDNHDTIYYRYDENLADELYGSEAYLDRLNELEDEIDYQIKRAGLDLYNDVEPILF